VSPPAWALFSFPFVPFRMASTLMKRESHGSASTIAFSFSTAYSLGFAGTLFFFSPSML
jgi:hypothetical protein